MSTARSRTCSPVLIRDHDGTGSFSSTDQESTPRLVDMQEQFYKEVLQNGLSTKNLGSEKPTECSEATAQQVWSVGSQGHPISCASPCKYFHKRSGCRQGANCSHCHRCEWSRAAAREKELPLKQPFLLLQATQEESPPCKVEIGKRIPAPPGMCLQSMANGCPSVGSMGHPHSCAAPCKYFSKSCGCKDGAACTRCHVCKWSRERERTKGGDAPMRGYSGDAPQTTAIAILKPPGLQQESISGGGNVIPTLRRPDSMSAADHVGMSPMYIDVANLDFGPTLSS